MGCCRMTTKDFGASDPIDFLMSHSDCDGEIPAEMCGPLADALQGLVDRHMPEHGLYGGGRDTLRFIAGLRLAASRGEPRRFPLRKQELAI